MSIDQRINTIIESNSKNKEELKEKPDVLRLYQEYLAVLDKLKLVNLKNEIENTASINDWLKSLINWDLVQTENYLDQLIESKDYIGLESALKRATIFLEQKYISFKTQAERVRAHNEELARNKEELEAQETYKKETEELQQLIDVDFKNSLKILSDFFTEEEWKWTYQYYKKHFDIETVLWSEYWNLLSDYNDALWASFSLESIRDIFLFEWELNQQVYSEMISIINSSDYTIEQKISKIKEVKEEIKEFKKKIDEFITIINELQSNSDINETEIDDRILETAIRGWWNLLSTAAKFLIAPIWFWSWVTENLSSKTESTWIDTAEFAASFVPIIWNFVDFRQAFAWTTMSWRELSTTERLISAWTWTLWLVLDCTWFWYFLRSGWKLAIKWTAKATKIAAKAATRWGDDLIKVLWKDTATLAEWASELAHSNIFKRIWANFMQNWSDFVKWVAERKLWIFKDWAAYAVDDFKDIVLWRGLTKMVWRWAARTINFWWRKAGWESWERFWNGWSLAKTEVSEITNNAWIKFDKSWNIEAWQDIRTLLDNYIQWNQLSADFIKNQINILWWKDTKENILMFIRKNWINDKEIITEFRNLDYTDPNVLDDFVALYTKKQDRYYTSQQYNDFLTNLENKIRSWKVFRTDFFTPQRTLLNLNNAWPNFDNQLALFWRNQDWTLIWSNIKTERIPNSAEPNRYDSIYNWSWYEIKLDVDNLRTTWDKTLIEFIDSKKIKNVDDLANQIKQDNLLNLDYTHPEDFVITRQVAEVAWENAFTKRKIAIQKKLKEIELRKPDEYFDLNRDFDPTTRQLLEWNWASWAETLISVALNDIDISWINTRFSSILRWNIDIDIRNYWDIDKAIRNIDEKIVKIERVITEKKAKIGNLEAEIRQKDSQISLETGKEKSSETIIWQFERELRSIKSERNSIELEITQDHWYNDLLDILKKTKGELTTNKSSVDRIILWEWEKKALSSELARIEEIEISRSSIEKAFIEPSKLNIEKVHSQIISSYLERPNDFIIDKNTSFNQVVENIRTNHWLTISPTNEQIHNSALYMWKLSNPDITDSIRFFISNLELTNEKQILDALTNEKWRHKLSWLIDTINNELFIMKSSWKSQGKEYLDKLAQLNQLVFLSKNSDTLKWLFEARRMLEWKDLSSPRIANDPEFQKILQIPELSIYITKPWALASLLNNIWTFSLKAKIVKKVAKKVWPAWKKVKDAISARTQDIWK